MKSAGAAMSPLLAALNEELAAVVSAVRPSLVAIGDGRGHGAGTIWHPGGLILTNAHVVAGSGRGRLQVTLHDGREWPAKVLALDAGSDLAALSVDGDGLPAITLARHAPSRPGDWVMALGHPWGVAGAVTAGIVIGVGPPPELPRYRQELIQVALALRPGHSGGPMVNARGHLVGINTMIAGPQVGLAIPLARVARFLKRRLGTAA